MSLQHFVFGKLSRAPNAPYELVATSDRRSSARFTRIGGEVTSILDTLPASTRDGPLAELFFRSKEEWVYARAFDRGTAGGRPFWSFHAFVLSRSDLNLLHWCPWALNQCAATGMMRSTLTLSDREVRLGDDLPTTLVLSLPIIARPMALGPSIPVDAFEGEGLVVTYADGREDDVRRVTSHVLERARYGSYVLASGFAHDSDRLEDVAAGFSLALVPGGTRYLGLDRYERGKVFEGDAGRITAYRPRLAVRRSPPPPEPVAPTPPEPVPDESETASQSAEAQPPQAAAAPVASARAVEAEKRLERERETERAHEREVRRERELKRQREARHRRELEERRVRRDQEDRERQGQPAFGLRHKVGPAPAIESVAWTNARFGVVANVIALAALVMAAYPLLERNQGAAQPDPRTAEFDERLGELDVALAALRRTEAPSPAEVEALSKKVADLREEIGAQREGTTLHELIQGLSRRMAEISQQAAAAQGTANKAALDAREALIRPLPEPPKPDFARIAMRVELANKLELTPLSLKILRGEEVLTRGFSVPIPGRDEQLLELGRRADELAATSTSVFGMEDEQVHVLQAEVSDLGDEIAAASQRPRFDEVWLARHKEGILFIGHLGNRLHVYTVDVEDDHVRFQGDVGMEVWQGLTVDGGLFKVSNGKVEFTDIVSGSSTLKSIGPDRDGPLRPEDLIVLSDALFWSGREQSIALTRHEYIQAIDVDCESEGLGTIELRGFTTDDIAGATVIASNDLYVVLVTRDAMLHVCRRRGGLRREGSWESEVRPLGINLPFDRATGADIGSRSDGRHSLLLRFPTANDDTDNVCRVTLAVRSRSLHIVESKPLHIPETAFLDLGEQGILCASKTGDLRLIADEQR